MKKKYTGVKKGILAIGVPLLIIGIILLILGLMTFGSGFGSSDSSFGEMNQLASKGFSSVIFMAGGGFLLIIGIGLIYFSQIGRVASYVATETAPAVETVGHAVGKGVAGGISDAGGIKTTSSSTEVTDTKDIRIKCRHCGFLESIDAEFCSKCGKKI